MDQGGIFVSGPRDVDEQILDEATGGVIDHQNYKKHFKEFLRQFRENNFNYKYRLVVKIFCFSIKHFKYIYEQGHASKQL
jgi:hypothetical protein